VALSKSKLALIIMILLAGSLMAGCSGNHDAENTQQANEQATQDDATSGLVTGAQVGNLAPNFTLKNISGGDLSLTSLKGKAVIIDFWDTWCPPCRRAMPTLQAISETYSDDLVIVGVAMGREGEEKVRKYVQDNGLTFEFVLADAPQYSVMSDFGGIKSIPTTFLVDRQGVIRKIWTGEMTRAVYENEVKAVLGI